MYKHTKKKIILQAEVSKLDQVQVYGQLKYFKLE